MAWSPPSAEIQAERAETAYNFFRSKGATHQGASALVASIDAESKFDPMANGDGGKALGLIQWHPDRRSANFPAGNFEGQLAYAWDELAGKNGNPNGRRGTLPLREALTNDNVDSRQIYSSLKQAIRWGTEGGRSGISGGRLGLAKYYEETFEQKGLGKSSYSDNGWGFQKSSYNQAQHNSNNGKNNKDGLSTTSIIGLAGAGLTAMSDEGSSWRTIGIIGAIIGIIDIFLQMFTKNKSSGDNVDNYTPPKEREVPHKKEQNEYILTAKIKNEANNAVGSSQGLINASSDQNKANVYYVKKEQDPISKGA